MNKLTSIRKAFYEDIIAFRNYDITSDDLCSEAILYFERYKKAGEKDMLLFGALLSAMELEFCVRTPAVYGNFKGYMEEIDTFVTDYISTLDK